MISTERFIEELQNWNSLTCFVWKFCQWNRSNLLLNEKGQTKYI